MKLSDEDVKNLVAWFTGGTFDGPVSASGLAALCREVLAAREMYEAWLSTRDSGVGVEAECAALNRLGLAFIAYDRAREGLDQPKQDK